MKTSGPKIPLLKQRGTPLIAALLMVCGASAEAATYAELVLADNPVAFYRLEEPPGEFVAVDSSPNGFDATYVPNGAGTAPELGLPGIDVNSVLFKGGPDFGSITIPFHPELSPTAADGQHGAAFSIECWVQARTQPADYSVVLAMFGRYQAGDPVYANASGWNFYQSPGPSSWWIFNLKNGAFMQASATPLTLLRWYHLAATYDGTNATFFVDGVSVAGPAASSDYLADNGSDGQVGVGQNVGFLPFNGGVDEIAFYTNVLTAPQILAHYQSGTNSFRAVPTAPTFLQQPQSSTNYSGTLATFSALAGGTPPPQLQWYRGASLIDGATNPTYSFTCSYPDDDGATFSVLASNSVNSLSSSTVTLTVLTNLNILNDPFSITRRAGSKAAFRTVAQGALPITYQWFEGTSEIANATNDTLWLSDVQLADDNTTYHARVANPFVSSTTADATLTVEARSVTVPLTGYAQVVVADDPVAYWRLNEAEGTLTATDAVGSFDGSYESGTGTLTYAAPSGIDRETDPAIGISAGAVVTIPYALELNPVTGPWSAEAWVRPDSLDPANFRTVFSSMWNSDFGNHLFGWNVYQHVAGVWTLNMYNGGSGGSFASDFVHNPLVPGSWYHMVITDDLTSIRFHVNGDLVVTIDREGFGFIPNGINGDVAVAGAPVVLGQRSDNAFAPFDGGVDEVAFYNRALSEQQIRTHYLNTVALAGRLSGANIILTWPFGTLQHADAVSGSYTSINGAASPYTNTVSGPGKFYRVQIQ
jgi:hypothetical protein